MHLKMQKKKKKKKSCDYGECRIKKIIFSTVIRTNYNLDLQKILQWKNIQSSLS